MDNKNNVKCPKCKGENCVKTMATTSSSGTTGLNKRLETAYSCKDCGYKWAAKA